MAAHTQLAVQLCQFAITSAPTRWRCLSQGQMLSLLADEACLHHVTEPRVCFG